MANAAPLITPAVGTPPVFIFVGHSGSGKTTLIEKLLRELTGRGLRVATIKHAHHKVVLDTPGKDSYRYKQAGAMMSMLVTSNELQLVADAVERREPAQLAQRFLGEADLVLAEGFSQAGGVKIEVLRRECAKLPRCTVEDGLIAIVTEMGEVYPQLPHFGLEDIAGIAQFMLDRCPLLNPLDEATSHSTGLQIAAAKSLVIPQAGRAKRGRRSRANESPREFHVK